MVEHPNARAVREGLEAFAKGEAQTGIQMFTDDAVIVAGGNNLMTGEYRGQDGILSYGAKEAELTCGQMSLVIEAIVGNDDYVFILSHPRYERNDRVLDTRAVSICKMQDGRVAEMHDLYYDTVAADRFWS